MSAAPTELREAVRLMRGGEWVAALRLLDAALSSRPGEPRYLICRAQCLMALRRKADALGAAAAAEQAAPADPVVRDAAATLYSHAGDHARALKSYDAAVAAQPGNSQYYYNRASVRRFVGDLAGAEQDYDRVIALRPTDWEAYKHRSDLRTQTAQRNHVVQLRTLLTRPAAQAATPATMDWRGEVQLRYALAKEYEDLGEYADSFATLESAARMQRQNMRYDLATDLATVQWIIDAYPPSGPDVPVSRNGEGTHDRADSPDRANAPDREEAPDREDAPIFVLGLPRSGTTLVERILSSHSALESAGELNCFALAMAAAVRQDALRDRASSERLSRREMVELSARVDFAALGRDYLRRARLEADVRGRFIDKMPLNYLYCGLIRRALPHAKMIHVTRHPMAVCYAMYKALFKDAYPFSYDLEEIAWYYLGYRRLMAHWVASMPGQIYTLSYEALVADQLGETRKLLEFCGLEWQEACARFHENPAPSATASAAQVRRPLYASAVSQWRHYEAQLDGLRAQLAAAGVPL